MSNEDTPESDKDLEDVKQPPAPTGDKPKETAGEKEDTTQKKCDPTYIQKEPINVIVNVPEKKENSTTIPNIIALGMLIVTGFLTYYTYQLFLKTKDSVQVAQDALADTRQKDNAADMHQKQRDSVDYTRDTTNTGLTKHSLDAQINSINEARKKDNLLIRNADSALKMQMASIKETERQFELANRPFLQLAVPKIYGLDSTQSVQLKISFKNLGKYPAKVIKDGILVTYSTEGIVRDTTFPYKGDETRYFNNVTIVNESDSIIVYGGSELLVGDNYTKIKNGWFSIFVWGYVEYENLLNGDIYRYVFMRKAQANRLNWQFVYSSNYFLRKKK